MVVFSSSFSFPSSIRCAVDMDFNCRIVVDSYGIVTLGKCFIRIWQWGHIDMYLYLYTLNVVRLDMHNSICDGKLMNSETWSRFSQKEFAHKHLCSASVLWKIVRAIWNFFFFFCVDSVFALCGSSAFCFRLKCSLSTQTSHPVSQSVNQPLSHSILQTTRVHDEISSNLFFLFGFIKYKFYLPFDSKRRATEWET